MPKIRSGTAMDERDECLDSAERVFLQEPLRDHILQQVPHPHLASVDERGRVVRDRLGQFEDPVPLRARERAEREKGVAGLERRIAQVRDGVGVVVVTPRDPRELDDLRHEHATPAVVPHEQDVAVAEHGRGCQAGGVEIDGFRSVVVREGRVYAMYTLRFLQCAMMIWSGSV